jgi:hypothetical protein
VIRILRPAYLIWVFFGPLLGTSWAGNWIVRCDLLLRTSMGVVHADDLKLNERMNEAIIWAQRFLNSKSSFYGYLKHSGPYKEAIAKARLLVSDSTSWSPVDLNGNLLVPKLKPKQKGILFTGGSGVGKSSAIKSLIGNEILLSAGERPFVFLPEIATTILHFGFPPPIHADRHPWDQVFFQTTILFLQSFLEAEVIRSSPENAILVFDRSLTDVEGFFKGSPDMFLPFRGSSFFGFDFKEVLQRFDSIFLLAPPVALPEGQSVKDGNQHRFRPFDKMRDIGNAQVSFIVNSGIPDQKINLILFSENPAEKIQQVRARILKFLSSIEGP